MCGQSLPPGARFCPSCGAKVAGPRRGRTAGNAFGSDGGFSERVRLKREESRSGETVGSVVEAVLPGLPRTVRRLLLSGGVAEGITEDAQEIDVVRRERTGSDAPGQAPAERVAPAGASAASQRGATLGPVGRDERRLVTVLFADISGFTSLSERHDAEAVKTAVDQLLRMLADVVESHGGRVDKFIGDNLMAVFGAPSAHEDDTERAARAALAMKDRVSAFNEEQRREGSFELDIRIGINAGEVMAGVLGGEGAAEYTVIGDAVNVAARLQQAAGPGEILVGEEARMLCSPLLQFGKPRKIAAKGKSRPVVAYPLEAAVGPPVSAGRELELAKGERSLFVGRQDELEAVRILARVARDLRRPYLITVLGEPGVGKTRLLEEASSDLAREGYVVLWGRTPPYGAPTRLYPLVEITRQLCGIDDGDRRSEAVDKVERSVRSIFGERAVPGEGFMQRLLEAMGLAESRGEQEVRDAAAPMVALIQAASTQFPVFLVFDDLHWADDELLDVVDRLSLDQLSSALVVCALARPELMERRPTWGGGRRQAHMTELGPLDGEEAARLVEAHFGGECSEELLNLVVAHSGGNPLFVSEMVAYLRSNGLAVRRNGRWDLSGGEIDGLPLGLRAVIGARLDALPVELRETIQVASVVGDRFTPEMLAALCDPGVGDVERNLRALVDEGLLVEAGSQAGIGKQFRFRHGLVRETAYRLMSRGRRSRLHSAVGEWMEARLRAAGSAVAAPVDAVDLAEDVDYYPAFFSGVAQSGPHPVEEIAYHYEQAARLAGGSEQTEAKARAFRFLVESGHRAEGLAMFREAKRLYERAHRLGPPTAASLEGLAGASFCLGLLDEAEAHVRRAVELAEAEGELAVGARARVTLAQVLHRRGRHEEAIALASEAERIWQAASQSGGVLKARLARAEMLVFGKSPREGIEVASEAATAARDLGNSVLESTALQLMGVARYLMGDTAAARRHFEEALVAGTAARSIPAVGGAIVGLGWLDLWEGCLGEVVQTGENILRIAHEAGELRGEGFAATLAGAAYVEMGKAVEAVRLCRNAVDVLNRVQDRWAEAMARFYLGRALAALGHLGEAESQLFSSYWLATQAGNVTLAGASLVFLAEMYRMSGRAEEAILRVREGASLFSRDKTGGSPWSLGLARAIASLAESVGEFEVAGRIRRRAIEAVGGAAEDRALAFKPLLLEHARACIAAGELEEAESACDSAASLRSEDVFSAVLERIVKGELAAARGRHDEARDLLREGFRIANESENVYLVQLAGDALESLYRGSGSDEDAAEVADASRRAIENIESLA